MSWVIETPGGAVPMTVTSAAATGWPSDGLRIVSPTIGGGGAAIEVPGTGWPPGQDDPPGCGRVRRPKAIRPTMTNTEAMTIGGTANVRRPGLGGGPARVDLGAAGDSTPAVVSEVVPEVFSWAVSDQSTVLGDTPARPSSASPPSGAGRLASSSRSATFRPHLGQNGMSPTRAVPQRGQNRCARSVSDHESRACLAILSPTGDGPPGGSARGWPPCRQHATIDRHLRNTGGRCMDKKAKTPKKPKQNKPK